MIISQVLSSKSHLVKGVERKRIKNTVFSEQTASK